MIGFVVLRNYYTLFNFLLKNMAMKDFHLMEIFHGHNFLKRCSILKKLNQYHLYLEKSPTINLIKVYIHAYNES